MSQGLGKNPIILNASISVFYSLVKKLTDYEKMQFQELENLENLELSIKDSYLGCEIK